MLIVLVILAMLLSLCISVEVALAVGIGVGVTYFMCSFALQNDDSPGAKPPTPPTRSCRSARRVSQQAPTESEDEDQGVEGNAEAQEPPAAAEQQQPELIVNPPTQAPTYRTHEVVRRPLKALLPNPPQEGPLSGRLEEEKMRRGHEPDARTWSSRMSALQDSMSKELTTGDGYVRPLSGGVGCKIPLGTF